MIAILAENQDCMRCKDVVRIWGTIPYRDRLLSMFHAALPAALVHHEITLPSSRFVLSIYSIGWQISRPITWIDKAHNLTLDLYRQEALHKTCYNVIVGSNLIAAEVVIAPPQKRFVQAMLYTANDSSGLLHCQVHDLPDGYLYARMTWQAPQARDEAYAEAKIIRQRLYQVLVTANKFVKPTTAKDI